MSAKSMKKILSLSYNDMQERIQKIVIHNPCILVFKCLYRVVLLLLKAITPPRETRYYRYTGAYKS